MRSDLLPDALIGHTGFVGSNLRAQHDFDALFNSQNISEIRGRSFGTVVCAGIQARKWWANQNADEDWRLISALLEPLSTVRARTFIMISTVDVYASSFGVDEDSEIGSIQQPYGLHRRRAEDFVRSYFPAHYVVRLPALFGPGLKKNVIFDLLHGNALEAVNPESVFQYYPVTDLWEDITTIRSHGISLMNLVTEPIATHEILGAFFPELQVGRSSAAIARYDIRTKHAAMWGMDTGYIANRESMLARLGGFIGDERARL